jgi:cytochrome c oxidase subunit II
MGEGLIDTRGEFQDLLEIYLPIGVAVAVIVFGLVLFAVVRYRRRDDELPVQREGLPIAEGTYALVLAGIVVFLLAANFSATDSVDDISDEPGQEVEVTGFQWGWRFTYPGEGVTVVGDDRRPPTLVVPTDTTVRFTVESRDVIHSFWIPELRFKKDAFPERENTFDLVFEEEEIVGRCAEFCGLAHSQMTFDVVGMPADDFDSWLRTQRRAGEIQHGGPS